MKKLTFTPINPTDLELLPGKCDYLDPARYDECKRTLARVLRGTSESAARKTPRYLVGQMVSGDFPAANGRDYCNGICCLAGYGDNASGNGYFTMGDELGHTYIYISPSGDTCLANIKPDYSTQYFKLDIA